MAKVERKIGATCAECPANCCFFGTGEKVLPVRKFLEGYMTTDSINARCENLMFPKRKCRLWGTPKLPIECRVHVCHNRTFTPEEVKTIDEIEEIECSHCGCAWVISRSKRNKHTYVCEICGYMTEWTAVNTTGNPNFKKRKR